MKNLVSAAMVFILVLGSFSATAAALETEVSAVKVSSVGGEPAGIGEVVSQAGRITDFGGTRIFWVLGGGLVAVSLVARRISA